MRWEQLFADLTAEMEEAERAERAAEVAERAREEVGRLGLVDRLRPACGRQVRLWLRADVRLHGVLLTVGPDWLLVVEAGGNQVLVPMAAVESVTSPGRVAAAPGVAGVVADRLDLRYALRRLVRDRAVVQLLCAGGSVVTGTLQRLGADHVELREHAPGERPGAGSADRLVALAGVVLIRSHG